MSDKLKKYTFATYIYIHIYIYIYVCVCVSPKLFKSFQRFFILLVVTNQNYFHEEVKVSLGTTVKLEGRISAETIVCLYQSARHRIISQVNHLNWEKNSWLDCLSA